jgi:hypothetical protein
MEHLGEILLYAVLIAGALWALIAVAGAYPLLSLAKSRLTYLPKDEAMTWLRKALSYDIVDGNWLAAHEFQPAGVYQVTGATGAPKIVAWKRDKERTYLCILAERRISSVEGKSAAEIPHSPNFRWNSPLFRPINRSSSA